MPSESGKARQGAGQGEEPSETDCSITEDRTSGRGVLLEQVLDEYLQELADHRDADRDRYLRAHPDLADALRGVFKTLDFVEATSRSLDASKLERGRQLGEYRIVRELSRGGMGVVYEAVQTSLDRRVALKVLPAGALLSRSALERFHREAAAAGRLHHTNIVPVYGVGEEQGIHFYAMQLIEGRSLADHLKTLRRQHFAPGPDYFRRVARWGQQAADALAYAHREGTIHRDVKPSNLLLDARDNVWITDFGLARVDVQASLTLSGDVIGTARYMSPEQARGGRTHVDERTDVYSLGATLYELLALTPAFEGESRDEVLNRIVFAEPTPLRQVHRAVPRDLETIVAKCMQKESGRRYAHAADVAEDCRRFRANEPIRARRTPVHVRVGRLLARHRVHAIGAALALFLAASTILLVLRVRHMQGQHCLDAAYDALLFEQNPGRASERLDEAGSLGIDSAEYHLCRGLIPLLGGRPGPALDPVNRALQRRPNHVEATCALALLHNTTGDYFNGQRAIERVAEQDVTTSLAWLLRGLARSHIQGSEAIESYDRAIALRPDFTPAIEARAHYRGARLLSEGDRADLQPMLNDFDAWVVFRPDSSRARAARACGWLFAAAYAGTQPDLVEHREEWLANARADLDAALEFRREDDSLALARSGTYLWYVGDYRGAADALAETIAVDRAAIGESHPNRHHERGIALYALGDIQAALDEIEPACAAVPSYYSLLVHKALLLAELGRLDEARAVCRDALHRLRNNATALFVTAAVTELLGEPDAAAAALAGLTGAGTQPFTFEDARQTAPGPALEFLTGRIDAAALMSAARGNPGRRCEFAFLIALRELGQDRREAGLATLQTCLDTGVFTFGEYRFARAMLERARVNPDWPAWVRAAEDAPRP